MSEVLRFGKSLELIQSPAQSEFRRELNGRGELIRRVPSDRPSVNLHPGSGIDEFSAPKRMSRCIVDHLDEAAFLTAEIRPVSTSASSADGCPLLPGARLFRIEAARTQASAIRGSTAAAGRKSQRTATAPSITPNSKLPSAPTTRYSKKPSSADWVCASIDRAVAALSGPAR